MPKASGKGIKVDTAAPTFGWADILGLVHIKQTGANDPTFAVYRGNLRQFQFANAGMREVFMEFHIPHDYLLGTDIHVHTHWSQIVIDTGGAAGVPGVVKWYFEASYAKGHGQAAFIAPITTSVTQQASATQYQHMLAETQLSAAGGAGGLLTTGDLEPDGVIVFRCYRDGTDPADTLDQAPFLHFCDVHYQTIGIAGTKQKAPDFYT